MVGLEETVRDLRWINIENRYFDQTAKSVFKLQDLIFDMAKIILRSFLWWNGSPGSQSGADSGIKVFRPYVLPQIGTRMFCITDPRLSPRFLRHRG